MGVFYKSSLVPFFQQAHDINRRRSPLQKDSIILPIKAFLKQYPRLTRFLANYVDHFYEDYSAYKVFLQSNIDKTYKLNLGSGADSVADNFLNVD